MTNGEWLRSLSDEELGEYLEDIQTDAFGANSILDNIRYPMAENGKRWDCFFDWLQDTHNPLRNYYERCNFHGGE